MNDETKSGRRDAMNERAKKARRETYQCAKERMRNDPKQIALKENLKERQREYRKLVKERRKNDPRQVALKENLRRQRREAIKLARDERKAKIAAEKQLHRTEKLARLRALMIPASKLEKSES